MKTPLASAHALSLNSARIGRMTWSWVVADEVEVEDVVVVVVVENKSAVIAYEKPNEVFFIKKVYNKENKKISHSLAAISTHSHLREKVGVGLEGLEPERSKLWEYGEPKGT